MSALSERWQDNPVWLTLAQPNYRDFAVGNIPNLLGLWVQRTTVSWLAWELTHSGFWLGVASMAELAPSLLLAPLAGALADRYSRLRILRIVQSIVVMQALLLAGLLFADVLTLWSLLLVVFSHGVVVSFSQPARMALVPTLTAREHLTTAVSLNATIFNLARFLGPMLAGVGLVWGEPAWLLTGSAIAYAWFWHILWRLQLTEEHLATQSTGTALPQVWEELRQSIVDGLRYSCGHPLLAPWLVTFLALCVGGRQIAELLPGVSDLLFAQGAEGLALLSSGLGLGAVIGSIWMSQQRHADLPRVYRFSALGLLLALGLLVWSPSFWLALPCAVLVGATLMTGGIATQTTLQLEVEPALRGRMLSLYGVIIRGGPAVGALLIGTAADFVGLLWPVTIALLVAAGVLWWKLPRAPVSVSAPVSSNL
jgi:MFS family permease